MGPIDGTAITCLHEIAYSCEESHGYLADEVPHVKTCPIDGTPITPHDDPDGLDGTG
jgi:hypothetical protein